MARKIRIKLHGVAPITLTKKDATIPIIEEATFTFYKNISDDFVRKYIKDYVKQAIINDIIEQFEPIYEVLSDEIIE